MTGLDTQRTLRVGVAGATGAVGKELMALLEKAPFVGQLVPMASPSSEIHSVEFRGESSRVEELTRENMTTCDLVVFSVPLEVAAKVVPEAMDEDVPVIDLSGFLGPDHGVHAVVSGVNSMDLEFFNQVRAVASPPPLVVVASTLLAPIRREVTGLQVRGTVLHSAAIRGRAGAEELSAQVVALFNARTARQVVFPQGLAFDVEPLVGQPGADGWTDSESAAAEDLAELLGLLPTDLALTELVAPFFSGICLSLHVLPEPRLSVDRAITLLAETPGLELAHGGSPADLPRPRSSHRTLAVRVGRVRPDPAGEGLHLWAVADELRFGAAGNAVAIMGALLDAELL